MRKGTIYLTEATWKALRRIAKDEGTTLAEILRQAADTRAHGELITRIDNHEFRLTTIEHKLDL